MVYRRFFSTALFPALRTLALALPLAGASWLSIDAQAAALDATSRQPTAMPAPKPKATHPAWKELTAEQQQALQPLALQWETLPVERKRKWLALSKNFHAMSPAEQAKLHARMREWVLLSQQQRSQARLNYAETQNLTAEQKSAQWHAYQQLSPEEKRGLAAKAPPKPSGAAVVRPLTPEKTPPITPTRPTRQAAAAAPGDAPAINRQTLLPQPPAADSRAATPVAVPAHVPEPAAAPSSTH